LSDFCVQFCQFCQSESILVLFCFFMWAFSFACREFDCQMQCSRKERRFVSEMTHNVSGAISTNAERLKIRAWYGNTRFLQDLQSTPITNIRRSGQNLFIFDPPRTYVCNVTLNAAVSRCSMVVCMLSGVYTCSKKRRLSVAKYRCRDALFTRIISASRSSAHHHAFVSRSSAVRLPPLMY